MACTATYTQIDIAFTKKPPERLLEMSESVLDSSPPAPLGNTYTSRPISTTAMQWTGENIHDLWEWITAEFLYGPIPEEPGRATACPARLYVAANDAWLDLEVGEWIIKDQLGFYPCKDSVFQRKYYKQPEPPSGEELVRLNRRLLSTTDAAVWAEEFCRLNPAMDEAVMIGWFANAIETAKGIERQRG